MRIMWNINMNTYVIAIHEYALFSDCGFLYFSVIENILVLINETDCCNQTKSKPGVLFGSWNLLYENILIHTIQKSGDYQTISKHERFCLICF